MFGRNVAVGYDNEQRGDALLVVSIFHTIQGEGPFAGRPATFVRLAHCNLKCTFCDTDFESGQKRMTVDEIVDEINACTPSSTTLVVVTGGEPFRQPLGQLVAALRNELLDVQIETSGSIAPHPNDRDYWSEIAPLDDCLTLVVSPKTPRLAEPFLDLVLDPISSPRTFLKYIVRAGDVSDDNGLPNIGTQPSLSKRAAPVWVPEYDASVHERVFVQPMDELSHERNLANTRAAVQSCMRFGYRLSVQLHKLAGVNLP